MFHWNPPSAKDSHEISHIIFSEKKKKKYSRLSSAAVVIGAFRVNNIKSQDDDMSYKLAGRVSL